MSAKEKAIELRKAGYTYSYISEKTGLSKSTLSYHLATIPFKPNGFTKKRLQNAQLASAVSKASQKQTRINNAIKIADKDIGALSKRDIFIAGIALYAGEGSKTQNLTRLVNADPKIIVFFLRWLEILGVPKTNLRLRIHGYPDTNFVLATDYWLSLTKLPKTQFQKPCIDTRAGKDRKRSGVHQFGTLHVTVSACGQKEFGSDLARKIKAYMDIVLG